MPAENSRIELGERTSADRVRDVLIVPLGSTEQHGPHLPLETDSLIAGAIAQSIADRARERGWDAALAPPVPYGASGEHEGFPGTISIGTPALTAMLVELIRSAARWAPLIVVVNGHGGNRDAIVAAARIARDEGRRVEWLSPSLPSLPDAPGPADSHAGWIERHSFCTSRPHSCKAITRRRAQPSPSPICSLRCGEEAW